MTYTVTDLTANGVRDIYSKEGGAGLKDPIFQCLTVKPVQSTAKPGEAQKESRYRAILSDGVHYCQGMLAAQMRDKAETGEITKDCIIRLTSYSISKAVQGKQILILLDFDVLGKVEGHLGSPEPWDKAQQGKAEQAGGSSVSPKKREASTSSAAPAAKRNGSSSTADSAIFPIEGLSPYQNRWTIKARVTSKSEIKVWKNARGEGKLFSVNLMDDSGEIKATGFNESVDAHYNVFQENKVFRVSKAKIVIAKKQFSNLNNEYEMTLEASSVVEECEDSDVPEVKYDFTKLHELTNIEPNASCDVIGALHEVNDLGTIVSKATSKEITKREIVLVDQSGYKVRATLWGKTAENFTKTPGCVMALKGAKVGEFGGRSLSVTGNTTVLIDPDLPEAFGVKGWYDSNSTSTDWKQYSNVGAGGGGNSGPIADQSTQLKTIQEVKDQNIGMNGNDKPEYFFMRATVVFIKNTNLFYPACTAPDCNKKVSEVGDTWECQKCGKQSAAPEYRYILSANAGDFSSSMWLNGFNEIGEQLIGMSANELQALQVQSESAFDEKLRSATHKMWLFNCRAKEDHYNGESRTRYTITKAETVDWVKIGKELARNITSMMNPSS